MQKTTFGMTILQYTNMIDILFHCKKYQPKEESFNIIAVKTKNSGIFTLNAFFSIQIFYALFCATRNISRTSRPIFLIFLHKFTYHIILWMCQRIFHILKFFFRIFFCGVRMVVNQDYREFLNISVKNQNFKNSLAHPLDNSKRKLV